MAINKFKKEKQPYSFLIIVKAHGVKSDGSAQFRIIFQLLSFAHKSFYNRQLIISYKESGSLYLLTVFSFHTTENWRAKRPYSCKP